MYVVREVCEAAWCERSLRTERNTAPKLQGGREEIEDERSEKPSSMC